MVFCVMSGGSVKIVTVYLFLKNLITQKIIECSCFFYTGMKMKPFKE